MQYSSTLKAETTVRPNGVLTSNRCFIAREFEGSSKMRTQMTVPQGTGALINDAKRWQSIDWNAARREVRRLQMRIAKAVKEGKTGRVNALQWLLTHSLHAKLLAVKRVTSNKIKAEANPYDPEYAYYCWRRRHHGSARLVTT